MPSVYPCSRGPIQIFDYATRHFGEIGVAEKYLMRNPMDDQMLRRHGFIGTGYPPWGTRKEGMGYANLLEAITS